MTGGDWGGAQVVLPGSVCGLAVPRGTIWREALKGTTQAGCLAAPRSPHKRPLLDTPSGLEIGPYFASSR